MAEGTIQLPVDGTGKALRTMTGGTGQPAATHQEVHTLALPDGTLVAASSPLPVVAAGVATQVTLAAVLAALAAVPVTAASLPLPAGAATQTTLAAVLAALASVPVSGPLTDAQLRAQPVPVSGVLAAVQGGVNRQKTHVEFIPNSAAPTTIYKGYAAVGTADSASLWTIQRFVFTGATNIDETWSSTTAVWNDRATTVAYT